MIEEAKNILLTLNLQKTYAFFITFYKRKLNQIGIDLQKDWFF